MVWIQTSMIVDSVLLAFVVHGHVHIPGAAWGMIWHNVH